MKKVLHPGRELNLLLSDKRISQADLAAQLEIVPSRLSEILSGKRSITTDLAILLEVLFPEKTANYWMKAQASYQLNVARSKSANIQKAALLEKWLKVTQKIPAKTLKLLKKSKVIKGNAPTPDLQVLTRLYGTDEVVNETSAETWKKVVKHQAGRLNVKDNFDAGCLVRLVVGLRGAFDSLYVVPGVQNVLSQFGIGLVIQSKFPEMSESGYVFRVGDRPMIGLTLQYKRIDYFALSIMRGLGHIFLHLLKGNSQDFFLESLPESQGALEADEFARHHLIPESEFLAFLAFGCFDDEHVMSFAREVGVCPAIVRGRLCDDGVVPRQRKTSIVNKLVV